MKENNPMSEIKNNKITNKQVNTYTVICFCCEREFEEKDITKIIVGKDKITGSIERRFVCKKCNHIPEYQKTPMEIIKNGEENEEE